MWTFCVNHSPPLILHSRFQQPDHRIIQSEWCLDNFQALCSSHLVQAGNERRKDKHVLIYRIKLNIHFFATKEPRVYKAGALPPKLNNLSNVCIEPREATITRLTRWPSIQPPATLLHFSDPLENVAYLPYLDTRRCLFWYGPGPYSWKIRGAGVGGLLGRSVCHSGRRVQSREMWGIQGLKLCPLK